MYFKYIYKNNVFEMKKVRKESIDNALIPNFKHLEHNTQVDATHIHERLGFIHTSRVQQHLIPYE